MPNALRIPGVQRGSQIEFEFDGQRIEAFDGESIAAALLAVGVRAMRFTAKLGEERGYFCGMGVCWECVVEVVDIGTVRACKFPVSAGLRVQRIAR